MSSLTFKIIVYYNRIIGVLLLVLGIWVILDPQILTVKYQIQLETKIAASTIASILGGGEITLGLILLFPKIFKCEQQTLLAIGSVLFGTIAMLRIYHGISFTAIETSIVREFYAEAIIASIFILLWYLSRKMN